VLVAAELAAGAGDAYAAGNTIVEVGNADFGSERTSLVLDADDNPVIAFSNESLFLSIVRCGDPECTSHTRAWSGGTATNVYPLPTPLKV
jgi:hypothetical protein